MQTRRLLLAALALLPLSLAAQTPAQQKYQTTPLKDFVWPDVAVPQPPTLFTGDGRRFLCYELLITNMQADPIQLKSVSVSYVTVPLLQQSGAELAASLRHPSHATPLAPTDEKIFTIAGGERVIDYIWIELSATAPVPAQLTHALTLTRPDKNVTLTVEAATIPVATEIRTIQSPLRGKNWVAANGPSNTSTHRRTAVALNGTTFLPERFAIDWLQVDHDGKSFHGDPLDNKSYLCFGQPLYAVADATVSFTHDGIPDGIPAVGDKPADPRVPITLETIGGNIVQLDLGNGVFAAYAHLQPGSLRVKVGDHVKAGQIIGLLGNSGNSTEAHLHFQLMSTNKILAAQGVPYALDKFTVTGRGGFEGDKLAMQWSAPPKSQEKQIPLENEILDFP
jgi:hypothetical protein